tara:strand:+ start:87 stop:566 length:480 start_codon:yes stop_codon:yes gene_type:complete
MEAKNTQELVEKYYKGLNEIYTVLKYTDKIPMTDVLSKNGLSNETRGVLCKGNVIKLTGLAKSSRWKWVTIPPTKQMALKTLTEVQIAKKKHNKIQREKTQSKVKVEVIKKVLPNIVEVPKRGGARPNSGRKSRAEELKQVRRSVEFSLFWGLITYKKQ